MRAVQAFAAMLCLAVPFALAACGGGGGGTPAKMAMDDPEPEPTPTPTPAPGNMDGGAPELRTPLTSSLTAQAAFDRLANRSNNAEGVSRLSTWNFGDSHPETRTDKEYRNYLYLTFGLPAHEPDLISEQNLNKRKVVFDKLYNSLGILERYNNRWPNIFMARTGRHCTSSIFSGASWGSCESDNPAELKESMINARGEFRANEHLHFHDSTMGYLDYSAFFLNRILSIAKRGGPGKDVFYADYGDLNGLPSGNISIHPIPSSALSIGTRTEADGLSPLENVPTATWKGGMIGMLDGYYGSAPAPCRECTYDQAAALENNLLVGNVEFKTEIYSSESDSLSGTIAFSNIADSVTGKTYEGWKWDTRVVEASGENSVGFHISRRGDDGTLEGTFYGPSFEEVGGTFSRNITHAEYEHITGAFGAKRQP